MRKLAVGIAFSLLSFLSVLGGGGRVEAQTYLWIYRTHATDCTSLTDGKPRHICYEDDSDRLFKCEPTAGDCDTAGEWREVNGTTTLTGDVTGAGFGSFATTIAADKVLESMLKAVDAASDEEYLTYETTTGDFEWQPGTNSFETISVPSGTNPVADSATDTLTITETSPLSIVGTAGTDTISFLVDAGADFDSSGLIEADSVALTTDTTGNYVASVADGSGIDVTGTAAEAWTATINLLYTDTLAGNPTMNADECRFSTDGTGGGIICEGALDAFEGLLAWNPAAVDRTLTLPDATDTLVGRDTTDTLTNKTLAAASNVLDADTAVTLAANGANCSASQAPLGVDTAGAAESCTDFEEELTNSAGLLAALSDETGTGLAVFGTAPTFLTSLSLNTGGFLDLDDQSELRFYETDANGENYLAFKAPAAVTTTSTCTLENDGNPIPDSCVGDGTDAGASSTTWDVIGDAVADGSVAFGDTTQDIAANTNDTTAIAQDVLRLTVTNDAATDILTQRLLTLRNASATGGTTETLLAIENQDNSAVTTGISIVGTSTGAVTTAVDVSDAEIGDALNIGANPIATGNVAGTIGDATTDSLTFVTDGTGNGEVVLPNNSIGAVELASGALAPEEKWIPCPAMLPLEAADSVPPLTKDAGTNLDQLACGFDDATDEGRTVVFMAPSRIEAGATVTFRIFWYSLAATTGDATWDIRHNSGTAADIDPDVALTTEAGTADTTAGTAGMVNVTTITETQTNLGWAANDLVYLILYRDANNASDTLVGDALVVGLSIEMPLL